MAGPSCTRAQSQAQEGHRGWDPSASNRWTGELVGGSVSTSLTIVAAHLPSNSTPPTFGNSQRRAPLVSQDVEANAAVGVDVGVVDAGCEVDLGGLKGIIGREMYGEEKKFEPSFSIFISILFRFFCFFPIYGILLTSSMAHSKSM